MYWLSKHLHELAESFTARSVTVRTTVSIVAFSFLVGLLFAMISIPVMQHREHARLEARLEDLASTVVDTVSIACFVNDTNLANQVANGLLTNRAVAAVSIRTTEALLAEVKRAPATYEPPAAAPVMRKIYSPFDQSDVVGELRLIPATSEIRREAAAYARYLGIILALQVAALAAVVARVVLRSIVRPIKSISDDLHRLEAEHGEQLALPPGTERNEIGRLTRDVNALIDKLVTLLSSERQQREDRERSERQLRLIFDNAENGIFTMDGNARLISWNPSLAEVLGLPRARSADAALPDLSKLVGTQEERLRTLIALSIDAGRAVSDDFEVRLPAGGVRWYNLLLQPIEQNRLQGMLQDVTARKQAEADAVALAQKDTLTGLLNRRGMELGLGKLLRDYRAEDHPSFTLMMMDLDWFKQVNDFHGHDAGDAVLRTVAARLQQMVRTGDLIARLGGDEFVIVFASISDIAMAESLAQRIVATVSEPIAIRDDLQAKVGASLGVALVTRETDNQEKLLRAADEAMYAAKQAGRCRVSVDPTSRDTPTRAAI